MTVAELIPSQWLMEGKEPHKGQGSVTGKRWIVGGEDTETKRGCLERTAGGLETGGGGGGAGDISFFRTESQIVEDELQALYGKD